MEKRKATLRLPDDVKEKLKFLRLALPPGVQRDCLVDATELLNQIRTSIDGAAAILTAAHVRKIHGGIYRWHSKLMGKDRTILRYRDSTIEAVERILHSATRIYVSRLPMQSTRRKERQIARLMLFLKGCLHTLVSFCENASRRYSWRHAILYIRSVSVMTGVHVGKLLVNDVEGKALSRINAQIVEAAQDAIRKRRLEEARLILASLEGYEELRDVILHKIKNQIVGAVDDAVDNGRLEEAQVLFASVSGHEELKREILGALARALEERGARLPFASQEWILDCLGISREQKLLEYVNPAESPEIKQLASFLLFLWDHAKESEVMAEVLNRFRVLGEKQFRLFLRGSAGATMPYDSRIHESAGVVSGRVRLLRPWVEWFSPPRAFVVIRGLAEAVDK